MAVFASSSRPHCVEKEEQEGGEVEVEGEGGGERNTY